MRLIAAVIVLVAAVSAAFAQDDRPKRVELAGEYVALTTADSVMQPMIDAIWPSIAVQFGGTVEPAVEEGLKEVFSTEIKTALADVMDQLAGLYADAFTLSELEAIVKFYRSETGAKLISSQGGLMQEMLPAMTARLEETLPEAVERVLAEAEAEGVTAN